MEKSQINMNSDLIAALDIEAMYPSINYKLIEKAVRHYCKKHKFSDADMETIEIGLYTGWNSVYQIAALHLEKIIFNA